MATIGVSKPYYGVYSSTGEAVTYSNGGVMGKATQVGIEIETTEDNNLHGDNAIAESDRSFASGTLTVGTTDLSQEVSKVILGAREQALEELAGVSDKEVKELIFDDSMEAPYLGVGVIIKKQVHNVIRWRAVVLTKVLFSVPSESATTQGETIEWQTPELTGTILRDDTATHMWKREAIFSTEAQAEAYVKARLQITAAPPAGQESGEEGV